MNIFTVSRKVEANGRELYYVYEGKNTSRNCLSYHHSLEKAQEWIKAKGKEHQREEWVFDEHGRELEPRE